MKRSDVADKIGDLLFVDWIFSASGARAFAKIEGVPHGRLWVTEAADGFHATIGYERGEQATATRCASAFGAISAVAEMFQQLKPPTKTRRVKDSGQGPLFGG